MKKLTYYYRSETETDGMQSEEILYKQERFCTPSQLETELAIAKSISYNGEVMVEDVQDDTKEPTQLDRVEAQTTYTAMMTDTLIMET